MNEYSILFLDGLIYLVGALILIGLILLSVRIFRGRAPSGGVFTAVLLMLLIVLSQNQLPDKLHDYIPQWDKEIILIVSMVVGFVSGIVLSYWRLRLIVVQATVTTLVVCVAAFGLARVVPMASERLVPSGPRLSEVIADAANRTEQAREAAKTFQTVNESSSGVIAGALDSVSRLTEQEAMDTLKLQFRDGAKFLAERKALMDAMTPQEREEYRKAMTAFLAEQGIAQDRYSLAALKNAKLEDVHHLVAFMQQMSAMSTTEPGTPTATEVRSKSESLQIILRNIRSITFEKEDYEAMAMLANIFSAEGVIAGIAQARADLEAAKIDPAWAGAFLAAAVENASGLPAEIALENAGPLLVELDAAEAAKATEALALARSMRPVISYVNLSTPYGYLRMPSNTPGLLEMNQAANQIPISGLLAASENPEDARVAIGKKSVPIGGSYTVNHGSMAYRFRFEKIIDGQVYVSCKLLTSK